MRWARHVAFTGKGRVPLWFLWGNLEERGHWEDPGLGGKIISKWIFKKWDGRAWIGLMWLTIGTGGG